MRSRPRSVRWYRDLHGRGCDDLAGHEVGALEFAQPLSEHPVREPGYGGDHLGEAVRTTGERQQDRGAPALPHLLHGGRSDGTRRRQCVATSKSLGHCKSLTTQLVVWHRAAKIVGCPTMATSSLRHVRHPDELAAPPARRPRTAQRAARLRPRHVPGPPLSTRVPRHLDAAEPGSRPRPSASTSPANVLNLPLRPPAVLARAIRKPRPALGRAGSSSASAQADSGMRSARWAGGADARPGASTPSRRRSMSSARSGRTNEPAPAWRRPVLPLSGAKRGPAPAHDILILDRRAEAEDAAAARPQGRRLAALASLPAARRPPERQRDHRRGRPRGRPRPARDPAGCSTSQAGSRTRNGGQLVGPARAVGGGADSGSPLEDGIVHLHRDGRRPELDAALRRGGRACEVAHGRRRARAPRQQ